MLGDRWGVTEAETRERFGCDDLVTDPALEAWRGVDVAAPAEAVWPWLAQVRAAPYSYDWIDNLGRRSPRRPLGLPEPVVGEHFTSCAGRPLGRIVAVDPGRELTATILGAHMSYRIVPVGSERSRLLLKIVMETNPLVARAVCLGDLVMARKQLLTLRDLAEGR
ncbi:hypothetical protein GCM10027425_23930 [Alteromonas gracilis]